ncbi:hypothetical protein BDK51DRAFT_36525 [Blyttiomyces helicus]|uniref:Phospholipid/glycerol acyltransferase domain-containing protein n=1 Tax=Blyttiomyces helicus TaxID=388810 RepID=A0A4P9WIT4_9FUNG|nr:hypothetical protein BDK51DRAFT_36525 [Blyttiomyces helicus]|eukprot:RKO92714.1 hypothetical protein BDK51DRAFT_36525 [Blyttiomyces helicus]
MRRRGDVVGGVVTLHYRVMVRGHYVVPTRLVSRPSIRPRFVSRFGQSRPSLDGSLFDKLANPTSRLSKNGFCVVEGLRFSPAAPLERYKDGDWTCGGGSSVSPVSPFLEAAKASQPEQPFPTGFATLGFNSPIIPPTALATSFRAFSVLSTLALPPGSDTASTVRKLDRPLPTAHRLKSSAKRRMLPAQRRRTSGGIIVVFPEGTSHSEPHLMDLKDGAAWAALQYAAAAADGLYVPILPVGITYEPAKHQWRTNLHVRYGAPIHLDPYVADFRANPRDTVKKLTKDIRTAIEKLTINAPDWNTFHDANLARTVLLGSENEGEVETINQYVIESLSPNHLFISHPRPAKQRGQTHDPCFDRDLRLPKASEENGADGSGRGTMR